MRRRWAHRAVVVVVAWAACATGAASEVWQADGPEGAAFYAIAEAPDGAILAGIEGGVVRYSEAAGSWEHLAYDGWKAGPLLAASSGMVFAHLNSSGGCVVIREDSVSFDGGVTWQEAEGLPDEAGGVVALAETPDGTVWAGTSMSVHLHRWDPGAMRWTMHEPAVPASFVVDLATTSDGALLALVGTGEEMESAVLRSDDGGASWSASLVRWPWLTSLATGADGRVAAGGERSGAEGVTFFVSSDDGRSWTEQPCGDDACAAMRSVTQLAVLPDGGLAAAGEDRDGPSSRLVVSDGAGEPWRVAGRYRYAPGELLVDSGGALWVVGLPYAWRSGDGGVTFEPVADGLLETIVTGLAETDGRILAVVGGVVYGGYSGSNPLPGAAGVHASVDGGVTWAPTPVWQAYDVVVGLSGAVLAPTVDGVRRSEDGGASWQTVPGTGGTQVAAVAEDRQGTLCLIPSTHLLSCTDDGGASWYGDLELEPWDSALAVAPDGTFLVESGGSVLRSVDRGRTWQPTPLDGDVGLFAVDPDGAVYATVGRLGQREVLVSRDGGLSWEDLDTPAVDPTALAVHPGWGLVVGVGGRAYVSTDRYATWTPIDIPSEALLAHGDRLVAGSRWGGVWLTDLPSRTRRPSGRVGP